MMTIAAYTKIRRKQRGLVLAEISAQLNVSHKVVLPGSVCMKMEGTCTSGEFPYKG